MSTMLHKAFLGGCALAIAMGVGIADARDFGERYGFGKPASDEDIAKVDIDVMADGRGAPPGTGTYAQGKKVYAGKCVSCHGQDLQGVKGTGGTALIGGRNTLASGSPTKTVESYWPYASTLFDFTKRAMPFNQPGSLSDDEVYSVVAYILAEAEIIDKETTVGPDNIGNIEMPNKDGFIRCDLEPCRPDVMNYH